MTRINTNVSSLVAQNTLARSNANLQTSLARLSTGLRINRGKDDPASLIASESLRSDIISVEKAITNSERANQLIATADSALDQVSQLINDIRGLISEAANTGALSEDQIAANQLQVDSSLEAIDRIAQITSFQGKRLLDGNLDFITQGVDSSAIGGLQIDQANFGTQSEIGVQVNVVKQATRGELNYSFGAVAEDVVLEIGGANGTEAFNFAANSTIEEVAAAVNLVSDATGVEALVESDASQGELVVSSFGADNDILLTANDAGFDAGNVRVKYVEGNSSATTASYTASSGGDPATLSVSLQTEAYAASTVTIDQAGDDNNFTITANVNGTEYDGVTVEIVDTGTTAGGLLNSTSTTSGSVEDGLVRLTANEIGPDSDNVTLQFVHDESVTQGNEVVEYDVSDPGNAVVTVRINQGTTTANDVIDAINADATVGDMFTADTASGGSGDRILDARSTGVTEGGAEKEERTPHTLGDVIEILNAVDPTRLQARISDDGDHIEITDLTSDAGYDFAVTSFGGGSAAEDLGLTGQSVDGELSSGRLLGGLKTVALSTLNGGSGLGELGLLDITDRSGATASIDLSAAETVEDVLTAINDAGLGVEASVNTAGNGIKIKDTTGDFTSNLVIANGDAKNSADALQITHDSTQSSVNSGSLHLQYISKQTTIDSLNGGQGIDRGKFVLKDSSGTARLFDLSEDKYNTLGDLIDAINTDLGINVEARINDQGDGLELIDKANGAQTMAVTSVGSYETASDLNILGTANTIEIEGVETQVIESSFTLNVDIEDGDTIEDLIQKVNDLDVGFSASVFNAGSGQNPFRLSIVSNVSGASGRVNIDSSNSSFDFDEIVEAQDALLLFGSTSNASSGVLTSSSTNSFHNVIDGVVLNLDAPSDSPVTISISNTDATLISSVSAFVDQYNKMRDKLESFTFFNESEDTTGILFGSNETLRIDTEVGSMLTDRYFGLGKFQSLQELGIEVTDTGELRLDQTKLQSTFADDPEAVKDFSSKETTGFSAKMNRLTEQFAGRDRSVLISRVQTLQSKIEINFQRIDQMTDRLERKEESLLKMFYNLELTLGKLQSNMDSISKIQYISSDGTTS
ncbi:MAG: flagellar filament capping protein FliD [Pirellulales bacterium]